MARSRRQFREMEVLAVLVMQGAIIPCKRCRRAFTIEEVKNGGVQKEHLHELALGGEDEPHNCAYSHTDCHAIITNGNGATTAGSSSNRLAKANNPGRTEKFKVVRQVEPPPVDDTVRCRRCGGYPGECSCPPQQQRSSFGRAR